jgi:hypothetical protein
MDPSVFVIKPFEASKVFLYFLNDQFCNGGSANHESQVPHFSIITPSLNNRYDGCGWKMGPNEKSLIFLLIAGAASSSAGAKPKTSMTLKTQEDRKNYEKEMKKRTER